MSAHYVASFFFLLSSAHRANTHMCADIESEDTQTQAKCAAFDGAPVQFRSPTVKHRLKRH